MARRQDGNLHAPAVEERIWAEEDEEESIGGIAYKDCEGGINLVAIARVEDLRPEDSTPQYGGRLLRCGISTRGRNSV